MLAFPAELGVGTGSIILAEEGQCGGEGSTARLNESIAASPFKHTALLLVDYLRLVF